MFNHSRYDVLVVGARCAGAATAMLMARRGLRVLVIDRGRYGADTTSTHALMRGGVMQLHRWGLLPRIVAAGTPAVRSTGIPLRRRRRAGGDPAATWGRGALCAAPHIAGQHSGGCRAGGRGGSPAWLHAGRIAPPVLTAVSVALSFSTATGRPSTVMADLVVGADGIGSTVARLAGARVLWEGRHATAVVYGHCRGLRAAAYSWYYREQIGAGVIPTNGGAHCVFVAVPPARFRDEIRHDIAAGFSRALGDVSASLAADVASARFEAALSVFAGRRGFLREAWGPGWALVGDAGYFKDPLTAHGMTDALRDAELLAGAAVQGSASRIRRLRGAARGAVAGAVRDNRCHRLVCLGSRHPAAMAPRTEHGNEARGRVSAGLSPPGTVILAGEGSMTDTSSTTGIAVTAWARTIKGRPAIGGFAERTRRTGMDDVAMFTEMTGDRNPLHYDAALAAGSPFGGLIVQGGVTSGLLNAVVAEDLPGPARFSLAWNGVS